MPATGLAPTVTPLRTSPETLARGVANLASFPDVYFKLRDAIDDPRSSLDDVARLLECDPVLAAGILRLANSAFFRFSSPVRNLAQAASLLGMFQIHDFVLATTVIRAFPSIPAELMDMKRFWRASIVAATAARGLADEMEIIDSARLFLFGLLAQIGRLVLWLKLPRESQELLEAAHGNLLELPALERKRWGFDYAEVGAALISAWRLPPELSGPIAHHSVPSKHREPDQIAAILHVAVAIAGADDAPLETVIAAIEPDVWQRLALELTTFREFQARMNIEADELIGLFEQR